MGTHEELRTEVPRTSRPPGQGPHPDPEVRFGYALKHAPALSVREAGVHLRELRVTEVDAGWRVMLKGDRGPQPVVAYIFSETYAAALLIALTSLDIGRLTWHHDAYPPTRYDNPPVPLRF